MSETAVRKVIGQAVIDMEFRDLLFNNPDKALAGLELTPEEVTTLKAFKREKFDEAATEMEERVSRAGVSGIAKLNIKGFAAMANCY
jgi:Ribosomally synthesized peptide prototyped by Frankia Franean1_4349.